MVRDAVEPVIWVFVAAFFAFFPLSGGLRGGAAPKLAIAAAIGLAVGDLLLRHDRPRVGPTQLLLLAFASWYAVAVGASTDPIASSETLATVIGWAVCVVAMASLLTTPARTVAAVGGYLAGCLAAGVWALQRWLAGTSITASIPDVDVNDLGAYTATAAVIAVTMAVMPQTTPRVRGLSALAAAVLSLSVLASLSRGSILALAIGLVVVFVAAPAARRRLTAGMIVAGIVAAVAAPWWTVQLRTGLMQKGVVADRNVSSRVEAWVQGANLGTSNWLHGVGPNTLADFLAPASHTPPGAFIVHVAHNTPIEVLYSTGLVGLALFGAFTLSALWDASSTARGRGPRRSSTLSAAGTGALVACLVCSMFTSQLVNPTLWLVLIIATAGTARALPRLSAGSTR
ncbi:MAG: O-antigen ligase family protein [Micrococcales bacterium]|nr:O-antigen ligase family protein [Micrococcales bacterium]